jgi:putative polyketide hydroxylase
MENSAKLQHHYPVVIVGGGLVGLSAACFLSDQKIPYLLIERHSATSIHPRSRGINPRTVELYRTLGLEDKIRQVEFLKRGGLFNGVTLTTLDWTQKPPAFAHLLMAEMEKWKDKSPVGRSWVTQDVLEPILLEEAKERGVGTILFNTEYKSVTQDDGKRIGDIGDSIVDQLCLQYGDGVLDRTMSLDDLYRII